MPNNSYRQKDESNTYAALRRIGITKKLSILLRYPVLPN